MMVAGPSGAHFRATEYRCENSDLKVLFQQEWDDDGRSLVDSVVFSVRKKGLAAFETQKVSQIFTPMGLVVTGVQKHVTEHHTTSYSLIIPLVQLKKATDVHTFETVLSKTTSKSGVRGPSNVVGSVQKNTFTMLTNCKASLRSTAADSSFDIGFIAPPPSPVSDGELADDEG